MTIADPRVTAGMAVPTLPGQTLNAAWVNNVSNGIQRAVDGVGGGLVQPSPAIEIAGDGLTVSGPFTASSADSITTEELTISDATNSVDLAARDVTRTECALPLFTSTEWGITSNGIIISTAATGEAIVFPITAPHGSTLKTYELRVQAAGGHGALPANMPALVVYKRSNSTGGQTTVGSAVDTSANVGAYQAVHSITVTGLSEVVNRTTHRYYAVLTNEFGSNSASGFVVLAWTRITNVTRIDEAD